MPLALQTVTKAALSAALRTTLTPTAAAAAAAARAASVAMTSFRTYASGSSNGKDELKKTALHDFHVRHGGKMVPFAGWSMPVQYSDLGVLASHLHTRTNASLFDVSHMLQTRLVGRDRVRFLESLVVGDVAGLPANSATLSVYTNERGGIIDDTVISNIGNEYFYIVMNAGCADKDLAHISTQLKLFKERVPNADVELQIIQDHSLLALQGPAASGVLAKLAGLSAASDLDSFAFMSGRALTLLDGSIPCHVTRCGYTGEDGFEISVPTAEADRLAEAILTVNDSIVKLAGLGARDSLRLEAGLCLYGNDLTEDITPVEAGLTWTIGKSRRDPNAENAFLGAQVVIPQIKGGVSKRRVGLIVSGAPAREKATIHSAAEDAQIGVVTSGCPSPSLKKNVAMGYVQNGLHKTGTKLKVSVRGKLQDAEVVKMPFVPAKYHKSA
ncbi:aminomethyltransferase precursor [Ramicandelaber brevisporus]|nr:aminomethyltransferase precursor [Ramicandelaber brevisporus]KAI8867769.1 aminomethyltransferase precursor [Ramicandelaber brevisporus]